jgi:endogenous inhibitor of DNA gyrase (YacG/DUF329 family)
MIDLGRWLDEAYRVPAESEGESAGVRFDEEKDLP